MIEGRQHFPAGCCSYYSSSFLEDIFQSTLYAEGRVRPCIHSGPGRVFCGIRGCGSLVSVPLVL